MRTQDFPAIRNILSDWYDQNARDLPWRHTDDPYLIWVSEIILQQTRVAQGLPYYERFVKTFPDVYKLANATETQIKKLWEGLGYYRRADLMHRAARQIVNEHDGKFPRTADELQKLPGIGPYTAAAVASFAYGEPVAVADGNVFRVLARLSGSELPVNTPEGQAFFRELAQSLLDRENPGRFNQSLMEFGALHCTPRSPGCASCPLQAYCAAYQTGNVERLPVKLPPRKRKAKYFYYLLSQKNNATAVRKRPFTDIWQGLYEFPGFESDKALPVKEIKSRFQQLYGIDPAHLQLLKRQKQDLTHRRVHMQFWTAGEALKNVQYIDNKKLSGLAFPAVLRKILDDWINMTNFDAE